MDKIGGGAILDISKWSQSAIYLCEDSPFLLCTFVLYFMSF